MKKKKMLSFFRLTKSKLLFIALLFFIGYLLAASLTYVINQCWIRYFMPIFSKECSNYVLLTDILLQFAFIGVLPLLSPLIKIIGLYNLYTSMSEYFVSLVFNILVLILEYAIICIFYWLYRKFIVAKTALIITTVVLTSSLLLIGLLKFTQNPDSVKIIQQGVGAQTRVVRLTGSTVAELLKETEAISEGKQSQFDIKFYSQFDVKPYITSYIDSFGPQITSLGFCLNHSREDEYVLEFSRGVEVVQKTWVVYGNNPICTGNKVTNWKAYESLGKHLNRILKDNSNYSF